MNNPEFEAEMLDGIDTSGYSERKTDQQIDKKDDANSSVKQFNRLVKGGSFIPSKKVKKTEEVVFRLK